MKIFQISDLHIIPTSDASELKSKIEKMCEYIRGIIPKTEQVIFFVLGDIGDGGNLTSYHTASELFDYLLEQLSGWNVLFEFIPGNHDLCDESIDGFDYFISKYQNTKHKYRDSPTFSVDYGGVNFIFVSSVVHNGHKNGQVNIESIKSNIKPGTENVLLLHHSLINEDKTDHSSIGNSEFVLKTLSTAGVRFVLHGHTHANRTIQLGDVLLVGSGSPIKDMGDYPNINNQFNIVQIENCRITGIANCRYNADWERYNGNTIFPIPQQDYADPFAIEKINYNAVEGYIEQTVLPYSIAASDKLSQYFNKEKRISLLEACKENRLLLLLSDAGTGKSVELNQLAHLLSDSASPYYPVRTCLNIYSGEEFVDLLPSQYRRLDPCHLFWIIDGFDELEAKYINDFKRQLAKYTSAYQQAHIVLSTRSNFCKTTTADKGFETFPGFTEYGICSLDSDAVSRYVIANNLNDGDFLKEIHERGLTGLESVPFYLIQMATIYKAHNCLPNKSELMDQLITLRFKWDSIKYDYTTDYSLDEQRVEIFKLMHKLAFSLQLLQKNYLTDTEYQKLFKLEERKLVQYSGIWHQVSAVWQFLHNNFREYLAAKLLSTMPISEITSFITYPDNNNVLKPEWVNTLSFLVALYHGDELLHWLTENAPNALVKFEPDRISSETRIRILKSIFSEYKVKNIWFQNDLCNKLELARFSESPEAIDYLLEEIRCPAHFRSQYNALELLMNFDNIFGKDTEVRNVLLECCQNPQMRTHECRVAISVLGELQLYNAETTKILMELFADSNDSFIRLGMYEYLIQSNNQDEFVDYFLTGIQYICYKQSNDKTMNSSEAFTLINGLKNLTTSSAVKKVMIWLVEGERKFPFYDEDEIFNDICQKGEILYLSGDTSMYETALSALCTSFCNYNRKFAKSLLDFFDNTGTRKDAFEYILTQKFVNKISVLVDVIGNNPIYMDSFAERYENNLLIDKQLFIDFVCRMPQNAQRFEHYCGLIRTLDGIEIPKRVNVDYEGLRRAGEQKYFNALFDKVEAEKLLRDLISLYGDPNITYEELQEKYDHSERRQDIEMLKWSICRNNFEDKCVANFFSYASWEIFSVNQIYEMMFSKSFSLIMTNVQIQYIKVYFYKIIRQVDFNTAVTHNSDDSFSFSSDALYSIFFLMKFDFPYDEKIFLDMLMLPNHFLSANNDEKEKYSYISAHVSQAKISARIEYNIRNRELFGDVFCAHIEYCKVHKLDGAIPLALDACLETTRSSWVKRIAFEYVLELQGEAFIYEHILPIADDQLFMEIIRKLYVTQNSKLESAMIAKYDAYGNPELLRYLIMMNSPYGLEQYTEIVKKTNKTPDFGNQIHEVTEAIGGIKNINLLPKLIELSELLFVPGFEDNEFGRLYSDLTTAITSMGTNGNYVTVIDAVKKLKNNNLHILECISFCSRILDDINAQRLKDTDKYLSLKDVCELFRTYNL